MFAPSSARRLLLAALAAVACAASPALAQGNGSIRGRVVDAASQRALPDVQVGVVGTQLGAVTAASGEFTIANVPAGAHTVQVRRIGFAPVTRQVTVQAGAEARLDVAIAASATQLDQVVVTGTAQATTKRALGNAVTQLNVSQLTEQSSLATVTDVLQSKSPGVTLVPGSGTAGTGADIRIRGTSSLSTSNRPLFFIDGVRFFDGPAGNFGPSGAGTAGTFSQGVTPLDFINPDDIESIEVIKGPAAATLYGADAAGGVIQIITKKGAQGQQRVRWTAKYEQGGTNWALPTLNNFTTCTQARIDEVVASGVNAGRPAWPGCQGLAAGAVITGNPLRDDPQALRTGAYQDVNLSARGGGDRFSFFVSGDFNKDEGVFYNNFIERLGGRANFGYEVSEKLDLQVNTSYTKVRQRLPLSDDAGGGIIISATRGLPGSIGNDGRGWRINLPEVSNQYDNRLATDRYITGITVNYRPTSWFTNRFTTGLDYSSPLATIYYAPGSGDYPTGFLAQRTPQTRLFTFDYSGSITNSLPRDFTSTLTFGAQGTKTRTSTLFAQGSGFPSADFRLIQNATTVSATSAFREQASLGYYVQEQIGYANRLFLTGAVRADDNSAFGRDFDRVFYPKASLSYVISEEPALASFFDRIKSDDVRFRFAYGQAGRAPGPYDAIRTFGTSRVVLGDGSIVTGLVTSSPGNLDLKPERGTEYEYGLDASFLDNRIGLELTAYNKKTTDALVSMGNAPSSGFTGARYINFGEISNSGVEIGLSATPVRRDNVTWEASATYATTKNRLDRLSVDVDQIIVYNPYAPSVYPLQMIKVGYPIGGFWGADVLRNADGSYATDSITGALQYGENQYVGPSLPTYEGAITNTVTFLKNFRLYALIDFKGGNYLYNQKDRNRAQSSHRNDLLFNNPDAPLSTLDSAYYSGNATRHWIQPADFVKLRDVSLSYTIPQQFARQIRAENVTVTLAGHNLGFISKKYPGIDPEVNFFGQGNFNTYSSFAQFTRTDSYTLPMMRRFTAAINVNF
ncbi:MAG TPA: SusC/RagA family TonB-linked outer membrane protein [Gemmatimonadaceae bacterium]|nr:SusC/RagA family TonB-linked outer membrane protein [Gemmatimonadaceae bacterium]